jgi:hypothetical protein
MQPKELLGNEWSGLERRKPYVGVGMCIMHEQMQENQTKSLQRLSSMEARQESMDKKLDTIMDNQLSYIRDTQKIMDLVTNGLKSKVDSIDTRMACVEKVVDASAWLQEWVTELRDKLPRVIAKYIFFAILAIIAYHIINKELLKQLIDFLK